MTLSGSITIRWSDLERTLFCLRPDAAADIFISSYRLFILIRFIGLQGPGLHRIDLIPWDFLLCGGDRLH